MVSYKSFKIDSNPVEDHSGWKLRHCNGRPINVSIAQLRRSNPFLCSSEMEEQLFRRMKRESDGVDGKKAGSRNKLRAFGTVVATIIHFLGIMRNALPNWTPARLRIVVRLLIWEIHSSVKTGGSVLF